MKRSIVAGVLVALSFVGGYAYSEYSPDTVPEHRQTETIQINSDKPIKV